MRKIVNFGLAFFRDILRQTSLENPVVDIPVGQFAFCLGKRFGDADDIHFHVEEITGRGLEFVHICSPGLTIQYVMDGNRNKMI